MCNDDTISKDYKVNHKTKSFKVIETFGYNGAVVVDTLRTLDVDILTLYALKGPLLVEKHLILFLRVLKGMVKTQSEESIRDFQNQVIEEYDEKATQEISGWKKILCLLKEDKVCEDGEEE